MRYLLVGSLALAGLALPAEAAICPAIPIPSELGMTCRDHAATAATPPSATVSPAVSLFSAFTGLSIRELPRDEKTDDVAAWLQRQVTYDLSGLGGLFTGLANDPDLPVQNDSLARSLENTGLAIGALGDLPLTGCGDPQVAAVKSDLVCHWNTAGVGLDMQVRLVAFGGKRYALRAWSMNGRRFQQLQALTNGFDPAAVR